MSTDPAGGAVGADGAASADGALSADGAAGAVARSGGAVSAGGAESAGGALRRAYALAVMACLAGAGLAAWAATRAWSVQVRPRPGLTAVRTVRTGAELEPWLIGLALVSLAGAGALLATHGRVRRVLGVLLALAGAGVIAGAVVGRAGLDVGAAGAGGTLWPVLCAAGGLVIAAGGVTAARLGHRWPAMSARYERRPAHPAPVTHRPKSAGGAAGAGAGGPATGAGGQTAGASGVTADVGGLTADAGGRTTIRNASDREPDPDANRRDADHRDAWDALDRGDDPTTA